MSLSQDISQAVAYEFDLPESVVKRVVDIAIEARRIPLTDRQREAYDAFVGLANQLGRPPKNREFGAAIGCTSGAAYSMKLKLVERRWLTHQVGLHCGTEVMDE